MKNKKNTNGFAGFIIFSAILFLLMQLFFGIKMTCSQEELGQKVCITYAKDI